MLFGRGLVAEPAAVNPDFYAVPYNYGRNNVGAFPLRFAARHNEDPAAIAALLGDGVAVDSMQGGTPALALAARSNGIRPWSRRCWRPGRT